MKRPDSTEECVVFALDIGGANLKLVTSEGVTIAQSFAMWEQWESLHAALDAMLREALLSTAIQPASGATVLATMTGELADCFRSKREGVQHIVGALQAAVGDHDLAIYLTDGQFVPPEVAIRRYTLAAASNWHALASYVASQPAWANCLLIDVGSTTCDVIPIQNGNVVATGNTDLQRLLAGELIYVGAERTSLSSVTAHVPYRGHYCSIAREHFATTLDVFLILGEVPPNPSHQLGTADGSAATREQAIVRLGRCLCADVDEWTEDDAKVAAEHFAQAIADLLQAGISRVYGRHPELVELPIVLSGHGEHLLQPLWGTLLALNQRVLLRDHIGDEASRAAPAYALTQLGRRTDGG